MTTITQKSHLALLMGSCLLSGCQTLPKTTPITTTNTQSIKMPIAFNISGKISITSTSPNGNQSATAFYSWAQQGDRFAIELTGALGIGTTAISFDGQTAKLDGNQGSLVADSPESLLLKATGWQAPISQLPYWIIGHTAPSDIDQQYDQQGKLIRAVNGDWTANFDYKANIPYRLKITHTDGHRLVMVIVHDK